MLAVEKVKRQPGFIMALVFHLLLFTIPLSTFVVQTMNDIELFVMDEEIPPVKREVVKEKKVEIPPPSHMPEVVREPEVNQPPQPIEKPVVIKRVETIEQPVIPVIKEEVIEPTVKPENQAIAVIPKAEPAPAPVIEVQSTPSPQFSVPPVTLTVEKPKDPEETMFGGENGPRFLKKELPVYPILARRLGKEGKVVLRLTIDERGRLVNIEVLENPGFGFADSAIDAVRKSTFIPAQKGDKTFATRAILPIRFALRRGE